MNRAPKFPFAAPLLALPLPLPLALALLLALTGAACTKDYPVPESTTTRVQPDATITARSADGMLELIIPAGATDRAADIMIATHRDVHANNLVGLVYEIAPRGMSFSSAAELRIHVPEGTTAPHLTAAALNDGRPGKLDGATYTPSQGLVRASIRALESKYYALLAQGDCPSDDPDCHAPVTGAGEGWDDPPGTGRSFIINNLAIAAQDRGFDLNPPCNGEGACIDNALWQLGELMNDQIRQGLFGGEFLVLLELSGLDAGFAGDDASLTLEQYHALDADDPFFPANNFKIPEGHTTCCEYKLSPDSITGIPPIARFRSPSRIDAGHLTTLSPIPLQIALFELPDVMRLDDVVIEAHVASNLTELTEGLMGGVWTVNALAQTTNPYCTTVNPRCPVQFADSTMLDMVVTLINPQPDIDRDGDGLEQLLDTDGDGHIDRCLDGCTGSCTAPAVIPPLDPRDPATCALDPRMADGYSIALSFTAVDATIVGVAAPNFDTEAINLSLAVGDQVHGNIEGGTLSALFPVVHVRSEASGAETWVELGEDQGYHFTITTTAGTQDVLHFEGASAPGAEPYTDLGTVGVPGVLGPPDPSGTVLPLLACQLRKRALAGGRVVVESSYLCAPLPARWFLEARDGDAVGDDVTDRQGRFRLELDGSVTDAITIVARDLDSRSSETVIVP